MKTFALLAAGAVLSANSMLVELEQHQGSNPEESSLNAKEQALETLDDVYEHHAKESHYYRSIGKDDREEALKETEKAGSSDAGIYGEILPDTVVNLLQKEVGAKKGMKYYDLGAGHGKTAALAYLLGLDAVGVEVVNQRWDNACKAAERMQAKKDSVPHGPNLRYVHGSFLEVDFSDGDIMLTDNLEFPAELTEGIAKSARKMKTGAKIVAAKPLQGPEFKMLTDFKGASSWANDSVWTIQEVVDNEHNKPGSLAETSDHKLTSQFPIGPTVCGVV